MKRLILLMTMACAALGGFRLAAAPESELAPLKITTETIAPLSTVEDRYVRLEAVHADGACRWQHEAFGYDVSSVTTADERLADTGFSPLAGDSEFDLPFDFPVNGRSVRTIFIGLSPGVFANCADGLRVDMRPYAEEFDPDCSFQDVSVKQGSEYVAFRWQKDSTTVSVLLDASGAVRYSYEGSGASAVASISILDGTEWRWSEGASSFLHDRLFVPRTVSEMPDGIEISGDGAVIGSPTESGDGVFRVRAEDSSGRTAVAAIAYGITDRQLTPTAPEKAVASERDYIDRIVIEWTGDDVAQTYQIYRSDTGLFEDAEFLDSTQDLVYEDFECEAEVDYCYFIRGVNGEFAGDYTTVWGRRAQYIVIATEILPSPEASVAYDVQLEAEGGQGAIRWEVQARGYDVTNAPADDAWLGFAFGEVGSEQELPFAFPINGSKIQQVFVMSDGELFFNGADGVRASLRPSVAPPGADVTWTGVGYRALGDRAAFRWLGNCEDLGDFGVLVELSADGGIRYAYSESMLVAGKFGFGQHLSVLDGIEWRWDGEPAQFGCDRVFTPQKYGMLPEGLMLSADGNLLGVPATNADDAVVRIIATDAIGEQSTRTYEVEVIGVIPSPEKAVDCENLEFSFDGVAWFAEEGNAAQGKFALRSGVVGNGGKSIVKTTVTGSGTLTFSWKSASLATDKTSLFLDKVSVTNITGNCEWTTVAVKVTGSGTHTIMWQFLCGKNSETTDGCAWLDNVCWESRELTLETALGQKGLIWETTGDAEWTPEEDDNGNLFGRSGLIGDDGYSEVSTTVTGAGTLTFKWRASSEDDYDCLYFYTNEVAEAVAEISGSTDWQTRSYAFGDGNHVLRWSYEKDSSGFDYDDYAELAGVTWTPAPENPTIEVKGHSLTVPAEWVTNNFPEVTNMRGEATKKLMATAANGKNTVWECYVAGLDPNAEPGEEKSEFTATVEMVDGTPVITWSPDLNEDGTKNVRSYKVMGATEIGGPWTEVPEGQEALYNFFTVTVGMPD